MPATKDIYWGQDFVDDVTGLELDRQLVDKARELEVRFFKSLGVYVYDTIDNYWEITGKPPLGVRWVDTNKGDNENPDVRCRLVAQEINTGADDDLYAATPPIEALKILIRIAAYRRSKENDVVIMFADVSRAYFNAKVTRDVFIKLPPEDPKYGEAGVCGRLQLSMYGTRDAAQN